uniref:Oxygen-regulated protein 1-like n=1 Tax=Pogona vitticeps TaxID=103695 RepID=A0ABM5G4K5_9SAUR
MFSASSYKGYSNDNNSESSFVPDNDMGLAENHSQTGEDFSLIPPADDIEKYVHLNQDGSMTVEMRVRFNIQEEETIKWTTSVSRAGTSTIATDPSSELNILTSQKAIEGFSPAEDNISLQQTNTEVANQDSICRTETNNYDIWQNPSMSTDVKEANNNHAKPKFYRPPTPGPRRVRQKKAMVESVTVVSDTEVQKKLVEQFSYSEETDNCETTSEYCVVTHSSSKTSNVINPELSEVCSSHGMKQLQDNHMEEKTLDTMRSGHLPDEDSSLQNVLEKADVEEGLSNGTTSGHDSSISHAHSSFKKYYEDGQPLPNQSAAPGREGSSFSNHVELSLLKGKEMLCNQCKELYSSQVSVDPPSPESNKIECNCTQVNPNIKESSSITAENDSVEIMTATQLSDESRALSSDSKKKKRKKKKKPKPSADTMGQDVSVKGIDKNYVKTSEMYISRGSARLSSSKITVHKGGIAADNSNKNLGTEEDLYSYVLEKSQKSEPASNLKKNINKQLPKLKAKSDKKHNLSSSTKAEERLLIKNESKHENELIKESHHETTNVLGQTPAHLVSSKPMVETESGETENGNIPSQKLPVKHRKAKKNKKSESELGSKSNTSDESRMSGALRHTCLTDEITEHSLENYVQSWLQNIFPDVGRPGQHLDPIYPNDRKKHQLSVKSFSEKDIRLAGKNVCLTQKNDIISDGKQSSSTLNKLGEIEAVEESVKKLYERHIGCLTDANASLIEQVKHRLQSDIPNTKSSLCNIHDKKKVPLEADDQKHISEIAAQIHPKGIYNFLGPNVQKDCVSSLLLHELKSAFFTAEKTNTGCITKPSCPADISSTSFLCSSSNLLVAWLLLLNLKESLSSINKDDIAQSTCRCSEILTLLQYLKQVAIKEEADDLNTAVSNMEDHTANCLILSAGQSETQESTCCQEKISLAETQNIPDAEEQGNLSQNLILNNTIESEETEAAKELSEELKNTTEEQKNDCMLAENADLNELDVHNRVQNLDSTPAQIHNFHLTSNEESLKENENLSLFDSQEKLINTSLNNEESELSEEPNSTSHSTGSQDRDHIFDLETSELDEKELNTEEKTYADSLWKKENSSGYPTSAAENAATDTLEDSVQEDFEENDTCKETSERLSTPSPLSFCYESKQIPVDASEEEPASRVKLIVKELECGSQPYSPMEVRKCLKSPATSDLSDYRPETDESFNNARPSSDLTNESADEAMYEKEYNKGYVKRTIERLYGKAEASFRTGPPYLVQTRQKDTAESLCTVMGMAPSFSNACSSWTDDSMTSSQALHEIPEDLNKACKMWEKENATLPAPQFSLNGEDAYCDDDCSVQYMNQHSQSQVQIAEDEGILIDKGKWLLKENHLIRRSPPENIGMCGNIDTTSTDTILDNHSDDIPYSHFGNLDQQPPLKEISSSELEDMAKPCDNVCGYFNMPHNSDSELFADALSIKSKNSQNGSTLPWEATSKICTTSTQICAEGNSPAFTSVEFRLPDNKVHPLQQPADDEPIQSQPNSNANSIRNNHEDQDSLDKLHAICGQHCPILTAIIKATNEEIRGCAYRKASDVENQMGLHLLMDTTPFIWQGRNLIGLNKNFAQLKNSSIKKISSNLFDRFYADNTLDFINDNTFKLLLSLKENQGLKKLYVTENMNVNSQGINNHGFNATKETLSEVAIGQNNNLPMFQNSGGNSNQIFGEKPAPSFTEVRQDCKSETFYHNGMFLKDTDWKVAVNLEGENALNSKEETSTYVKEHENGNEHSES